MSSDYVRELLGGDDNSDRESDGSILAEIRGDTGCVAPWETAETALADLRRQESALLERMAVAA